MTVDDATVTIPLIDGTRLSVTADTLVLSDRAAVVVRSIAIVDIAGVSRGGRDLNVTRHYADPVLFTAATIADAHRFMTALREQQTRPPSPLVSRRGWRWRKLSPPSSP